MIITAEHIRTGIWPGLGIVLLLITLFQLVCYYPSASKPRPLGRSLRSDRERPAEPESRTFHVPSRDETKRNDAPNQ